MCEHAFVSTKMLVSRLIVIMRYFCHSWHLQVEQISLSQLVNPGTVAAVMEFFEKYEVMAIN